ncbi:MAG TPA: hypothetical protein VJ001_05950 [Rhodocyclaceae bacterium]|nr:hypothetical protein [Rhodocyclaceae bacterium]
MNRIYIAWMLVLLPASPVVAGSLSFNVTYVADTKIGAVNTGNERAYAAQAWQLDGDGRWQTLSAEKPGGMEWQPGQALGFVRPPRTVVNPTNPLIALDPVMFRVHDQAGSAIPQLSWRASPPLAAPETNARVEFDGERLRIFRPLAPQVLATHAIAHPYAGIARLATPVQFDQHRPPPPAIVRHDWRGAPWFEVNVGAGQTGVWLLHEMSAAVGGVAMQIVPDRIPRGTEQRHLWLRWAERYFASAAAVLAGLGFVMLSAGLFRRRKVG